MLWGQYLQENSMKLENKKAIRKNIRLKMKKNKVKINKLKYKKNGA